MNRIWFFLLYKQLIQKQAEDKYSLDKHLIKLFSQMYCAILNITCVLLVVLRARNN